jgi:hypothetical protein
VFQGRWYEGPKAAFKWLRKHRPDDYASFESALAPGADLSGISDLVARIVSVPRASLKSPQTRSVRRFPIEDRNPANAPATGLCGCAAQHRAVAMPARIAAAWYSEFRASGDLQLVDRFLSSSTTNIFTPRSPSINQYFIPRTEASPSLRLR